MRGICILLISLLAASVLAAPPVQGHISREDVQQICAVVSSVTREPIHFISAEISNTYVPGSIPQDGIEDSSKGRRAIKLYERTDRVSVHVGHYPQQVKGDVYYVQKFGSKWKVVGKGGWIR